MNSTVQSVEDVTETCDKTNADNILKILERVKTIQSNIIGMKKIINTMNGRLSLTVDRANNLENKQAKCGLDVQQLVGELTSLMGKKVVGYDKQMKLLANQSLLDENRPNLCNFICWVLNKVEVSNTPNPIRNVLADGLSVTDLGPSDFVVVSCTPRMFGVRYLLAMMFL